MSRRYDSSQAAYDEAVIELSESRDWLQDRLLQRRFLLSETLTEADIRLVTALLRFDEACHRHFKCNRQRIVDYRQHATYQAPML